MNKPENKFNMELLTDEEKDEFFELLPVADMGVSKIHSLFILSIIFLMPGLGTIRDADTVGFRLFGVSICLPFVLCLLIIKGYDWARIALGTISILFAAGFTIAFIPYYFDDNEILEYVFFTLCIIMLVTFPIVFAIMTLKDQEIKAHCKVRTIIRKKIKEEKRCSHN